MPPMCTLTVAETLSVNVQLEPGAVSEEVQVRADQIPDIDLETSQVSNLVDQARMQGPAFGYPGSL